MSTVDTASTVVPPERQSRTATPPGLERRRSWDRLVASAALLLLGVGQPLAAGATTATLVVVGLLPVWLPSVRRSAGVLPLLLLSVLAVPAGLLLAWTVGPPAGRGWDVRVALATALLLLTAVGAVGLVIWARSVMSLHRTALLLGVGLLLDGVQTVPDSVNPWKYALSLPVTVIVLALVGSRRPALAATFLVALSVVGIANESRSYAAFCVLTAALVLWRAAASRRGSRAYVLLVLGALGFTAYQVGTELLLQGYLGRTLQERSAMQVQNAGSLIAGGRPEWAATFALLREHPLGFGLGAVPSSLDLRTAKEGLEGVGISGSNGYVNNYMFGNGFKLHSIAADLWAGFGVLGVALAALLVVLVLRALSTALSTNRAVPVVVFLSLMSLWWLAFGPSYSNLPDLAVALGLALPLRGGDPEDGPARG